jgi:cysteinyl-tRNA synthetase
VFNDFSEEDLEVGVRDSVEADGNKRNKADFVLWFTKSKFDDQELKWDSPFGVGYPGWHIECSCIASKHLGEYLDIHCGGIDNAFPHHTNEIAQTESTYGHEWCKYWFHVHHLNTNSGKMSKSKGEFLTVSLLMDKGFDPLVYRFFCMQSHYRKNLVFSWENLENARAAYDKLIQKVASLKADGEVDEEAFAEGKKKFCDALDNDLNTSLAVTALYDVFKMKANDATKIALIKDFEKVLDLGLFDNAAKLGDVDDGVDAELVKYINEKIEARKNAKANKNYAEADAIRQELLEKGITLIDTREGTKFEINK